MRRLVRQYGPNDLLPFENSAILNITFRVAMNIESFAGLSSPPLVPCQNADGDNLELAADLEATSHEMMEKVDAMGSVSRSSFSSKASYSSSAGKWSIADDKSFRAAQEINVWEESERKARFAEDIWGSVQCSVSKDPEPFYEDEMDSRWFSLEDFAAIRDEVRNASAATRETDYHMHFMKIYKQCDLAGTDEEFFAAEVEESAGVVARSEFRGLELTLFDVIMQRSNSEVAWSVLDAQDIVRNSGQSYEKRTKVLSAVSRKLSKRARRVAFVLGVGDMIAAEEILGSPLSIKAE